MPDPTRDAEQAVREARVEDGRRLREAVGQGGFLGSAKAAARAMYGETVRSALDDLARWPQSMNRDEFLADVEVLLTAVRQAERAKCAADYLQKMSEDPESAVAAEMARVEERARIRGIVQEQLQVIMRDVARWGWNTEKRSSSSAYESVLAALSSEGT